MRTDLLCSSYRPGYVKIGYVVCLALYFVREIYEGSGYAYVTWHKHLRNSKVLHAMYSWEPLPVAWVYITLRAFYSQECLISNPR